MALAMAAPVAPAALVPIHSAGMTATTQPTLMNMFHRVAPVLMRMSIARPYSIRTIIRIISQRSAAAAGSHFGPYRNSTAGSASIATSTAIGTRRSTTSGITRWTPRDRVSSLFSDSREKPGSETNRIAEPRKLGAQLDTLTASR